MGKMSTFASLLPNKTYHKHFLLKNKTVQVYKRTQVKQQNKIK